ncbi:S9 family peptidase [Pseudonocardiaceae bacterium YIM PH 21723]|nr:S9 family peptidase [Pseudonocardiaceae bacterium YIM PH 21723]
MVKISPYGTWASPITSDLVSGAVGRPQWVDSAAGDLWWAESRPTEGGRAALMRQSPDGTTTQVLDAPWNVRNRLHEYGSTPFVVLSGEAVAFTNWSDQRVYLVTPGQQPRPLSPQPEIEHGYRYGDLVAGPDATQVWCVRETVTGPLRTDIRRDLVALPADGSAADDPGAVVVLGASHHFMTTPKPSPDGQHVAWIGWDHPAMPWDGSELCVAELTADGFGPHRVLTGGPQEAVCQLAWSPEGELYALTDPQGWWNLHKVGLDGTVTNVLPREQEIGGALWALGLRWFVPLGGGRHVVITSDGLGILDEQAGEISTFDTGRFPGWYPNLVVHDGAVASIAGGPLRFSAVVSLSLEDGKLTELTKQPATLPGEEYLSVPEKRWFTNQQGQQVPAYVFQPVNPDHRAPEGEKPPFLVHVHGGPTSAGSGALDLQLSYFLSRGIGVVVVNYGGSTGYGREFRERLREQWGVVDVYDCSAVAEALAAEGTADPDRLAIRGGSAGGWTTAASLTTVDTYRCGASFFPILELDGWTGPGTHDFESRYVEGLVGPLPETIERYRELTPANNVDKLAGPILFLQGLEDEICPPEQCERFVAKLAGSGIPHAYIEFEGEQHGFRRAENIRAALEAELSFYGQVLGFEPVDTPVLPLKS